MLYLYAFFSLLLNESWFLLTFYDIIEEFVDARKKDLFLPPPIGAATDTAESL